MRKLFPFLAIFVILFSGCDGVLGRKYTIGVDPSFSPAILGGQDDKVYGFTLELLEAVSRVQGIELNPIETGSQSLFAGLRRKGFQGVTSIFLPNHVEVDTYKTSDPFMLTGPVIVVKEDSSISSVDEMNNQIVGVLPNSSGELLAQQNPNVVIYTYMSVPLLLEAISQDVVDVGLVDVMVAKPSINNLYQGALKINSKPLNDEGLRLITVKGWNRSLIANFNIGLAKVKKRGIYKELCQKWEINL